MEVFLGRLRGYFKLLIISSLCLQDQLRGDFYCGLTSALVRSLRFIGQRAYTPAALVLRVNRGYVSPARC